MKTGKLIKLSEAAVLAGCTITRMRQFCSQDRIPGARRVGGNWKVPKKFTITPGTRGPKPSGARRAHTSEVKQPRPSALQQWRKEFPHYAKAYDEWISSFGPDARINPNDFERIARRNPQRRGKGRGENSDALGRSPTTGGGWFVEGGNSSKRSPDDPLYDVEGEDHVQQIHDRSGDTEDHHLTPDERVQDERFAADDSVDENEANDDPGSKLADVIHSSVEPDDDQDYLAYEEHLAHEDEKDEIGEYVQLIREYVKSGAAASSTQSGYPILDAMRAVDVPLTINNYVQIYVRINYATKAIESLSLDQSVLPPMFRLPRSTTARATQKIIIRTKG